VGDTPSGDTRLGSHIRHKYWPLSFGLFKPNKLAKIMKEGPTLTRLAPFFPDMKTIKFHSMYQVYYILRIVLYILAIDRFFLSRKVKNLQPVEKSSINYFFEIEKNVTCSAARYLQLNGFLCRKTLPGARQHPGPSSQ